MRVVLISLVLMLPLVSGVFSVALTENVIESAATLQLTR